VQNPDCGILDKWFYAFQLEAHPMRRMTALVFVMFLLLISSIVYAQDEDYTVEYGDTLDVIAAGRNVSVACIAEASGLTDPNSLRPGDTLVIPSNCPPYDGLFIFFPADEEAEDAADQGGGGTSGQGGGSSDGTYTVQYGDVVDVIAQQFNASVTCIAEASDIPDFNVVRPGDTLVIPSDCPPYDGLFIQPEVEEADDTADQGGGGTTSSGQGGGSSDGTYTIQYGDVIDLLAQEFNLSVTCIAEASGLEDFNRIRPGDTIVLDPGCPPYDGLFIQPEVEAEEPPAAG
jgi:LysM repeat protein